MPRLHTLDLPTPVLNSACPWSSDFDQLLTLYKSPFSGAVTTRTATMEGGGEHADFDQALEDDRRGKHTFLNGGSSLNFYGYSPRPLSYYITAAREILSGHPRSTKPIIISITSADPVELRAMLLEVLELRRYFQTLGRPTSAKVIGVEINLSCPNIPGHPPPSYQPLQALPGLLGPTLAVLPADLTLGLKLPPYTHVGQFSDLVAFLEGPAAASGDGKVAYLACCNTLGGCLGFDSELVADSTLSKDAGGVNGGMLDVNCFAGMAGEALHPLALGNVRRLALLLAASPVEAVRNIALVGIGGASDAAGVRRFLKAGATAVACATALGVHGPGVFERMTEGLE